MNRPPRISKPFASAVAAALAALLASVLMFRAGVAQDPEIDPGHLDQPVIQSVVTIKTVTCTLEHGIDPNDLYTEYVRDMLTASVSTTCDITVGVDPSLLFSEYLKGILPLQ